ncbi:MAG TPA: MarR family winged helix-turn-helix transcriptional regulator [Chloroflexota bacterium]|nr:MarR family winged helix-turn-helix transcriptional regulator [Chloroflexota bacterium]
MHVAALNDEPTVVLEEALDAYRQFAHALCRATHTAWLELDLSIGQLKGLLVVAARDAVIVGDLAELVGIGRPAASHLVDQLYHRGLITRTEDPVDRRRSQVRLTTKGSELIAQLYLHDRCTLSRWVACLEPADLGAMARGLRVLAMALADTAEGDRSAGSADLTLFRTLELAGDYLLESPSTGAANSAYRPRSRIRPRAWSGWSCRRARRA